MCVWTSFRLLFGPSVSWTLSRSLHFPTNISYVGLSFLYLRINYTQAVAVVLVANRVWPWSHDFEYAHDQDSQTVLSLAYFWTEYFAIVGGVRTLPESNFWTGNFHRQFGEQRRKGFGHPQSQSRFPALVRVNIIGCVLSSWLVFYWYFRIRSPLSGAPIIGGRAQKAFRQSAPLLPPGQVRLTCLSVPALGWPHTFR